MAGGFTDQFTNVLISPVNKRYRLVTLTADTDLIWPIESATSTNTLLEWMDVTADAVTWDIGFPDATEGAQGFATIIVNTGTNAFTVNDFAGDVIQVIAAGEAWLIWLKDNSTEAGDWQALQIGSTTSEASAATLAGQGLTVIGLTLNQSHPVWDLSGNYTVVPSIDRARLLLWTSGSGVVTFPAMAQLPDNWFTLVANQGSAAITLTPTGAMIDGASTKTLNIGESCFVVSDGSNLYTVGYGRSSTYTETYLNLSVAGSADVTLTASQFASNIIRVFGTLTGDINVLVPAAVHEFIFVNDTTGAHTVTCLVSGQTGITVAQGESSVLYCNGTDVFPGNTSSTVTNVQFGNGTVTAPSITFQSDSDTGFFRFNTNTIGVAAGGVLSGVFNTAASAVNALTFTPAATGVAAVLGSYSGTDTDVGIAITPQGAGTISLNAATTVVGAFTASRFISTISTGTAPLTVTSTTRVSNLNVAQAGVADTVTTVDAAGDTTTLPMLAGAATGNLGPLTDTGFTYNATTKTLTTTTFVGAFSGNAATATALVTPRAFSIAGSTGLTAPGVNFDGTAAVALALTGTLAVANGGTGQTSQSAAINALLPTQTGNSGKVLTTNGTAASWGVVAPAFTVIKPRIFSSNGTYTPDANLLYAIIECWGPGGGGAGTVQNVWSNGGASGSYSLKTASVSTIGASQSVVVGTGGAGGAAGSNNGSAGSGDTSVGTLCIAKPGQGAVTGNAQPPAAGGVAGTGDIATAGNPGGTGFGTSTIGGFGGVGGASSLLGAGRGGKWFTSAGHENGQAATSPGSGGGGASQFDSTNSSGGNGADGFVKIIEYCSA